MEKRRTFRKAIAILLAMVFCGLMGITAFAEADETASPKYTFTLLRIQTNENGEPVTNENGELVTEVVLEGDLSTYCKQSTESPIPIDENGRYRIRVVCTTESVQIEKFILYMNAVEMTQTDDVPFTFAKGDKCRISVEPYRVNKPGQADTQLTVIFIKDSAVPTEPAPQEGDTGAPAAGDPPAQEPPVEDPPAEPEPRQPVIPEITEAAINPGTFYLSAEQTVQLKVVTDTRNCKVQILYNETQITDAQVPNESNECSFNLTGYVTDNPDVENGMTFKVKVFYPSDPNTNLVDNPGAECDAEGPETEVKLTVVEKVQFLEGTSDKANSDDPEIKIVVNKTEGTVSIDNTEYSAPVDSEGKDTGNATIKISPAKEEKRDKDFIVVYKNEKTGEKGTWTVKYTYNNWAKIVLKEPEGAIHLYNGEGNEGIKVDFAAAGEEDKTIEASLVFKDGSKVPAEKTEEKNHFSATYGQLKQTNQIEFNYPENTYDPDLKKSIEIKNEGEPDAGTMVIFWHTLEIEPVDNDSSEIVVRGAIPHSEVQLIIGGEKEPERKQKAADDGTVSFNTVKLKPETKIEAVSTDSYGGTTSVTASVVKASEFKRIAVESVSGVTEEEKADLPQDENGLYYTNRDIVITGTGHAEQALTALLAGPAIGEREATEKPPKTDAAGAWSVPVSIEKLEDGDYQLLIRYPDYEESLVTVPFRLDRKVDIRNLNGEGQIEVEEGATSFVIEPGETISEATFTYYGMEFGGEKAEEGNSIRFAFKDPNASFRLNANEETEGIFVHVTDFTGNEATYSIRVVAQRLKVTMNDAEIGESGTSVFLTDSNSLVFRTEGTSDSAVKVMAIFDGAEPRLLRELAKGEEFVLNAGTFEGQLKENDRFGIQLIQADGAESWVTVTYDPACALELNTAKDDRGEFLPLEKTVTEVSGTTDAGATVTLVIRHKDAGAGETNIQASADGEGKFTFSGLALQSGDTLTVQVSDAAGNTAEKTLNVKSGGMKSPAGIFLLVAGMILMGFSVWFFLNTQKKIRQMEEISAANAATVREKNKEKR